MCLPTRSTIHEQQLLWRLFSDSKQSIQLREQYEYAQSLFGELQVLNEVIYHICCVSTFLIAQNSSITSFYWLDGVHQCGVDARQYVFDLIRRTCSGVGPFRSGTSSMKNSTSIMLYRKVQTPKQGFMFGHVAITFLPEWVTTHDWCGRIALSVSSLNCSAM